MFNWIKPLFKRRKGNTPVLKYSTHTEIAAIDEKLVKAMAAAGTPLTLTRKSTNGNI